MITDTERFDWIERTEADVTRFVDSWHVDWNFGDFMETASAPKLRDAIDAAMQADAIAREAE